MTEGIIQRVFSRYIDRTAPRTPPFDTLSRIEQEVIANIISLARTHDKCEIMSGMIPTCNFVQELIGDSE